MRWRMVVQARILREQTLRKTEDMMSKTIFFSKMRQITDTNVEIVNMLHVKERLKEGQSPLTLEEIQKAVAHHNPSVDTSISTMMSDVGMALDFEDIREEDINETRLRSILDELGKVAIKKKHLNTLFSLNAFIGFAKEYEKDHEKTLQAKNSMMKSAELKIKHRPCPPMEEVNERLARFIALARRMKEEGRFILEDHLI